MALNLLKLAVGAGSCDDVRAWNERNAAECRLRKKPPETRITTRMAPKRADEIIGQGSLFWVVKGAIQVRQRVIGMEAFKDAEGTGRIHIILEPSVVLVRPRPCRPFQGWRYLRGEDAPADFELNETDLGDMPPAMRRELLELCLI